VRIIHGARVVTGTATADFARNSQWRDQLSLNGT
jgi:hypothetical protein